MREKIRYQLYAALDEAAEVVVGIPQTILGVARDVARTIDGYRYIPFLSRYDHHFICHPFALRVSAANSF